MRDFNQDVVGTSLQGYVSATFSQIVSVFGEPVRFTEEGETSDVEWVIHTPFGVATIYDYKTGKNYEGEGGTAPEDNTDWHIGAHTIEPHAYIIGRLIIEY